MSIMASPRRASLLAELRENPIFLRDMAIGIGWRRQLSGLTGLCLGLAVLWFLTLLLLLGAEFLPDPQEMNKVAPYLVPYMGNVLMSPIIYFPLGFIFSYRRFRDARKSGFFRDIYFTRLSSTEIIQGKLAALMLPPLLLLAWFAIGLVFLTLFIGTGGGYPGKLYMFPLGLEAFGRVLVHWFSLIFQMMGGFLGLFGGVLGGMQMAMLSRPGKWMPNSVLHLALAFSTMCCCMFMALIYLIGYRQVQNEFWWHAVYLDQEDISRGGRMEG